MNQTNRSAARKKDPQTLEREIDETRAKMDRTLVELEENFYRGGSSMIPGTMSPSTVPCSGALAGKS
jgi:hypothetical protein